MAKFGTDGIRGDATRDLTPRLVTAIGAAAVEVLGPGPYLIGRDTRESGPRLVAELTAGIRSRGGDAISVGVLPTPAVAFLAAAQRRPALMISASHNVWSDNGIKLFGAGGTKIDDDAQAAIEQRLADAAAGDEPPAPPEAPDEDDLRGAYVAHVVGALEGRRLDGLSVVLDTAHGAASVCAPEVFRALGATVRVIHDTPDGRNINEGCGSTHPEALQRAVREHGADLGLAFDGDADRVLAVDERGELVDGDQIMVLMALDLDARGALRNRGVAVTVMSNLGLHRALGARGIRTVTTPVGDRHVVAALAEHGFGLGGEQSGHIVFADLAGTGDGTLTGVLVADCLRRSGMAMAHLAAAMTHFPQVLENLRLDGPLDLDAAHELGAAVRAVEAELGDRGRVLVRASGTEPLLRLMVEADTDATARAAVDRLVAAARRDVGGS